MTSRRKHKKVAASLGLSERELLLTELLEEVLDEVRWLQILGYSNQFLMNRHLEVDPAERDRILEAATRTVDKGRKLHEWHDRLARIKSNVLDIRRGIRRERKDMERRDGAPGATQRVHGGSK